MNFGMREALRLAEEGLDQAWARHRRNAEALWRVWRAWASRCMPLERRLPTLTTVIPDGVDGKAFSQHLLTTHGIEVGGGLGFLAGQIWRIGLMVTTPPLKTSIVC